MPHFARKRKCKDGFACNSLYYQKNRSTGAFDAKKTDFQEFYGANFIRFRIFAP